MSLRLASGKSKSQLLRHSNSARTFTHFALSSHPRTTAMLFVLCRDPLEPARPDRSFQAEVAAIERLGQPFVLVDHDALVRGDDPAQVVRRVPQQPEPVTAVFRGWMVTPSQYRVLYETLAVGNIRLINDPDQYRHCHHLPECYPIIEQLTPR